MPKVIVTDLDNALMNAVGSVFPSSTALLCRYPIIKNVRANLKPAVGTKDFKGEDENIIKASVVVEIIMDVWAKILNYYIEDLYAECNTVGELTFGFAFYCKCCG